MKKFNSDNNKDLLKAIHQLNNIDKSLDEFGDEDVIMEYVVEKQERNDFQIAEHPGQKCCSTLICRLCGNDRFIVGQKEFYSAISCLTCGYQIGIHEG